jgi:hypothetical protein
LVAQALLLAPAPIVFIAFAAVLTGSFNVRMALLTEALAGNVSNVAQKKAFLNSPDTKLKDNIRKRHEKVSDTKIKIKHCRRSANFGLNITNLIIFLL